MNISIFGLGYVGCVTAGCLGSKGHRIVGVDLQKSKVEKLNRGKPTVLETGLTDLVGRCFENGLISAVMDGYPAVLETDASIICVGTSAGCDGALDLAALRVTAELIGRAIREKSTRHPVILRSTVPAGTAEQIVLPLVCPEASECRMARSNLTVVPEFLREGSAISDYYDPPFQLVGSATGVEDENAAVIHELFSGVVGKPDWVQYREAEMLKAVCNAYHAVKVSFANEIGALCEKMSVDGRSLMARFVKDKKLNISPAYLRPGLPFGGSCLPKDLGMLVHEAGRFGVELSLLRGALASNDAHLKRIIEGIPTQGRRRVGLVGLAFKAGTDDLRESPLVLIAEHLLGKGCDLRIYDPAIKMSMITGTNMDYIQGHIPHLSSRLVQSPAELVEHSDVILLARECGPILDCVASTGKKVLMIDLLGENRVESRHF